MLEKKETAEEENADANAEEQVAAQLANDNAAVDTAKAAETKAAVAASKLAEHSHARSAAQRAEQKRADVRIACGEPEDEDDSQTEKDSDSDYASAQGIPRKRARQNVD